MPKKLVSREAQKVAKVSGSFLEPTITVIMALLVVCSFTAIISPEWLMSRVTWDMVARGISLTVTWLIGMYVFSSIDDPRRAEEARQYMGLDGEEKYWNRPDVFWQRVFLRTIPNWLWAVNFFYTIYKIYTG